MSCFGVVKDSFRVENSSRLSPPFLMIALLPLSQLSTQGVKISKGLGVSVASVVLLGRILAQRITTLLSHPDFGQAMAEIKDLILKKNNERFIECGSHASMFLTERSDGPSSDKNKTNHPISSNSHASATAKQNTASSGVTKPTGTSCNFDEVLNGAPYVSFGKYYSERCFFDFSVSVGAFAIGLSQVSSFFSH